MGGRPASVMRDDDPMTHEVLGLDHVQLTIPAGEEPRAVLFYNGILGLPQLIKPEPLASRGGCWFQAGAVQLHLGAVDDFVAATKAHPALIVDGLASLIADLEAAGHDVRAGATIDGVTQTFTDDPFGNRIELIAAI